MANLVKNLFFFSQVTSVSLSIYNSVNAPPLSIEGGLYHKPVRARATTGSVTLLYYKPLYMYSYSPERANKEISINIQGQTMVKTF